MGNRKVSRLAVLARWSVSNQRQAGNRNLLRAYAKNPTLVIGFFASSIVSGCLHGRTLSAIACNTQRRSAVARRTELGLGTVDSGRVDHAIALL